MGKSPPTGARGARRRTSEAVTLVAVQLEEHGERHVSAARALPNDAGFADFAVAGSKTRGEFRCADCGYGAIVHREVPPCPMCGGTIWEIRATPAPSVSG
jgi:rubrerythrin